jgi:hypothetical protein
MGGARLRAIGRCIFAMRITTILTFDEYWIDEAARDKRPVRNGSSRMVVGDNIYHSDDGRWLQSDSHHSNSDGSINHSNLLKDTSANAVLISKHYYYFGKSAVLVPAALLSGLGYNNGRNYRVYDIAVAQPLVDWISGQALLNRVLDDPFDFGLASARYSDADDKIHR